MNKKILALVPALSLFTLTSFAQTIKEDVKKKTTEQMAEENAAKADVYIHKKNRIIFDKDQMQPAATQKKKKKKSCKASKRS